jgi:hypothetical protein
MKVKIAGWNILASIRSFLKKIKWDCRRYGMNWERFTGVLCKYKHEVS